MAQTRPDQTRPDQTIALNILYGYVEKWLDEWAKDPSQNEETARGIAEAMNCTPESPMSFAIRGFIWGMGYGIELALATEDLADEKPRV